MPVSRICVCAALLWPTPNDLLWCCYVYALFGSKLRHGTLLTEAAEYLEV